MALFSAPPTATAASATFGSFNSPSNAVWGGVPAQPQSAVAAPQQASMMGNPGVGAWGGNPGWGAPAPAPVQSNVWATPAASATVPAAQSSFFNTSDVWGSSNTTAANPSQDPFGAFGGPAASAPPPKKDDAFGDIWGGFK